MPDGRRYGYHWYRARCRRTMEPAACAGRRRSVPPAMAGQRLFLLPRLDMVVAVTAGNYDTPDQWRPPMAVLRDVVLPSLNR